MAKQRISEIVAIGAVIGIVLVTSLLISQEVLLWFGYTLAVLFLYLLWRFVCAIESMAETS